MIYENMQLESIEKIIMVFSERIKQTNRLELLWSDKMGYILFPYIPKDKEGFALIPQIVQDAQELLIYLLSDIAYEFIEQNPRPCHDLFLISDTEKGQIQSIYQPYMVQLPEYADLIEVPFENPFKEDE